jgi:hypothetical protein
MERNNQKSYDGSPLDMDELGSHQDESPLSRNSHSGAVCLAFFVIFLILSIPLSSVSGFFPGPFFFFTIVFVALCCACSSRRSDSSDKTVFVPQSVPKKEGVNASTTMNSVSSIKRPISKSNDDDDNLSPRDAIYCPACGEKLPADARFCSKCGETIRQI